MPPRLLAIIAVLVPAAMAHSPEVGAGHGEFRAVNHILAEDGKSGIVWLPRDATLASWDIDAGGRGGALILTGPSSFWLLTHNDIQVSSAIPGSSPVLKRGSYHVYLAGATGATAQVSFEGLEGHGQVHLDQEVKFFFGPLPPSLPVGAPHQRYSLSQPFAGETYSGFFLHEAFVGAGLAHAEKRWSTDEGVVACISSVSIPVGPTEVVSGSFLSAGHDLPLTLTYYQTVAAIGMESSITGYWVQRAPTDLSGGAVPPPVPLGWSLVGGHPLADQDALCAGPSLGAAVG